MIGRRSKDLTQQKKRKRAWEEDEDDEDAAADGDKKVKESDAMRRLREEELERERIEEEHQRRSQEKSKLVPEVNQPKSEPVAENIYVFLEIEIRSRRGPNKGEVISSGRMEFELYRDTVPRTVENFRCLCTGEKGNGLSYENASFHRIIPGFMAQGGDITDHDGTGGDSIYGSTFQDENFRKTHNARGLLSMANSGPNTNNSQFFILFKPTPHLDRKHVVFGKMVRETNNILKTIENAGSPSGETKNVVKITNVGEVPRRRSK